MNLTKKRKKKGFTLIELMAVIAIIAILAAVLVPTVTGYINRAKKTAIITQVRNVVSAVETYNATASKSIDTTLATITSGNLTDNTPKVKDLVDVVGSDILSTDNINKLGELRIGTAIAINKDSDALNKIQVHSNGSLYKYDDATINESAVVIK
ncbi:type II secretion system protein [Paraclostridium bifermentans]|uniref:type II secretion system protein n=1 Tax=Paraclostridium bifermentans TaxID=1490 RepID=UPI00189F59B1|nr:prepilin-type N-terminal cleavage/methylation domain-containing protein [Paraclostridium bifermentans]